MYACMYVCMHACVYIYIFIYLTFQMVNWCELDWIGIYVWRLLLQYFLRVISVQVTPAFAVTHVPRDMTPYDLAKALRDFHRTFFEVFPYMFSVEEETSWDIENIWRSNFETYHTYQSKSGQELRKAPRAQASHHQIDPRCGPAVENVGSKSWYHEREMIDRTGWNCSSCQVPR